MTRAEILNRVVIILNEKENSGSLISQDTVSITETINNCITPAVKMCNDIDPMSFLIIRNYSQGWVPNLMGHGAAMILNLPPHFGTLNAIQLNTWQRPVTKVDSIKSASYKLELNPHVCSKPHNPHAYFTLNTGVLNLLLFPKGDSLIEFSWFPKVDGSDIVLADIRSDLIEPISYMCAALVLQIYENDKGFQNMKFIAETLLKNLTYESGL